MQNGPPEQSDVLRFICEENKPQLVSLLLHAGERLPPGDDSAADHLCFLVRSWSIAFFLRSILRRAT
eukprot:COSAG05_NODE_562_length_8653_cov_189.762333_3_plen_67_part_00